MVLVVMGRHKMPSVVYSDAKKRPFGDVVVVGVVVVDVDVVVV